MIIAKTAHQILHRAMIQMQIGKAEMLHAATTRVIFNYNRTTVLRKLQNQVLTT